MSVFEGKVAAITGSGTGGMGARVAEYLAANGAKVVVNDLQKKLAEEVADGINAAGGIAVANASSVTDKEGGLVDTAIEEFGRIDILINCAGITCPKRFVETTEEEFLRELNVHVLGTFTTCKAAVPHMIEQGDGGRIINISSRAAFFGAVDIGYTAAKAAIAGMGMCMATDLKEYGIQVNTIIPSAQTKLFSDDPSGRPAAPDGTPPSFAFDPKYLAPCFGWLSSKYAEGVTGKIIYCCGGDIVVHSHPTKINDYPLVIRKPSMWTMEELGEVVTPMILQKG